MIYTTLQERLCEAEGISPRGYIIRSDSFLERERAEAERKKALVKIEKEKMEKVGMYVCMYVCVKK